jgi:hypothetical protein
VHSAPSRWLSLLFFALAGLVHAAAEGDPDLKLAPGQMQIVPSFEAGSYYFQPPAGAERETSFVVEFRRAGEPAWRRAFPPVTDRPTGIWKGSLFHLTEDTGWELRVQTAAGAAVIAPAAFRTWSSHPPIARVVDLSQWPTGKPRVISEQGTPTGWIKYTAPAGWRLEAGVALEDAERAAITFRRARYVILENVTITGGAQHGVLVEECEAVRVLNCDISGWGRVGTQQFTNTGARGKYADARGDSINYDAGVSIQRSAGTVVERCYIHDPRGRANSWMFSHPAGPTAMHVNNTLGGNVVRWNDFVGSDEHRWNDVIESSNNGGVTGGFFRDSDISGNFLALGNDDGVELEGGGMNVRFYRNKIEGTTCSISTGACLLGPQFIFENLVTNPGDESGLALWFFKNSHGTAQGGKRHFINNTLTGGGPGAYGSYGKPAAGTARIGFMRNNIFVCSETRRPGEWATRDDFDRDLFWAGGNAAGAARFLGAFRQVGQEEHALAAEPQFRVAAQGDFHLAPSSPARGQAAAVPNLATAGGNLGALGDAATEVPFRPLALVVAPRQLNFAAPAREGTMEITLTVPPSAPAPVPFEIRQNRVFDWFRVTPASGQVAPGRSLTLKVTVNPARLQGRPIFRGAFLVRSPNGLSRPVSVYAATDFREDLRPAAAASSVYLEAAALPALAPNARPTTALGVSGGKSVPLAGPDGTVAATFTLQRAGKYALLARVSPGRDVLQRLNLDLSLDGAAAPVRVSANADYQWNTGATNFRVVFLHALDELAAGEHQLRLRVLAGELNLNELIITDNPAAFFIDEWQRERP